MRPTHELIETYEHCRRAGIYSRDFEKCKLTPQQMLMEGIREGLTVSRSDFWQAAGERCFELAVQPGLDSKQFDLHAEVVHLCALSDVLSAALRKGEPWKPVEPIEVGNGSIWESDAFLDPSGDSLRRIVCVSVMVRRPKLQPVPVMGKSRLRMPLRDANEDRRLHDWSA